MIKIFKNKNVFFISTLIMVIIFFTMYFGICNFYQLAADDYSIIYLTNENGIIGTCNKIYFTWSGNYVIVYFLSVIISALKSGDFLLIYFVFLIILLSFSSFKLFSTLNKLLNINLTSYNYFLISFLFIVVLFFSSFDITQNWFWIDGSLVYFFPIFFIFLYLFSSINYVENKKRIHLISLYIFGICFGNSTPNYVISFIICLIVFFNFKKLFSKQLLILLSPIMLGFFINLISPGNINRKEIEELSKINIEKPDFIVELFNSQIWTIKQVLSKFVYISGSIFPIHYFFKNKIILNDLRSILVRLIIAFIFSSIANSLLMIYAVDFGVHERTMMFLQIELILIIWIAGFLILEYINFKFIYSFSFISLIFYSYLSIRTLQIQYPIISKYETSNKLRLQKINNINCEDTIVILNNLNDSGLLFSSEIGKDTSHYINSDMRKAMNIKFSIKIK